MRQTTAVLKTLIAPADTLRTSNIQEEQFILGNSFSVRDYFTATAATSYYIHFNPTASTGLQIVFSPLIFDAAEAGPITVEVYGNPTLTAGGRTAITQFNRRATSANTSQVTVEFVDAANVTDPGTRQSGRLVSSSSSGGVFAATGGQSAGGLPFEIDPSFSYLIKLTNTNGVNSLVEYNATWFEIPVTGA